MNFIHLRLLSKEKMMMTLTFDGSFKTIKEEEEEKEKEAYTT